MLTLKNIIEIFSKGKSPKGAEFEETWKSFWHKSEKAPMEQIVGLNDALNNKASHADVAQATINNKGYKPTIQELKDEYPKPKPDWYAYIGETKTIWVVKNGVWIDSGDPIPEDFDWSAIITSQDGDSLTKAISQHFFTSTIFNGGVRNWKEGVYPKGSIVKYNNLLWEAKVDVTSAMPPANGIWELYKPTTKSIPLLTSHSSTLIIDLVDKKITFKGASSNNLITEVGNVGIPAQEVDISEAKGNFFILVYNIESKLVRFIQTYNNGLNHLASSDLPFACILTVSDIVQDVYGIKGYTLINKNGTTKYPIGTDEPISTLYNKLFSKWSAARTEHEKTWLNQAIVDVELYNIEDNATVVLYGLGKKYGAGNLCYLGLYYYRETPLNSIPLYVDEFDNTFSQAYDIEKHSGIKTYYLRHLNNQTYNSNNIYGKIIIDWDAVPMGERVVESNSGIFKNSHFGRWKYVKSNKFRYERGIIKFAKSRSFYDYYNAPRLDGYAGIGGKPTEPFGDVEKWLLKWDELITNCPKGYTIKKRLLTDQVPTDTNDSGKLSMYAFNFKPDDLANGNPGSNNAQTFPKIVIDCSIHGGERMGSFVTYEMMKQILFNWKSHSFLEYLRYNVEFAIIPVANPHGWNAGSRHTINKVDPNRNFPADWVKSQLGSDTYGGEEPLSEIECQAIYQWMQDEKTEGTILGVDFHNFFGGSSEGKHSLLWIVNSNNELGQNCSNVLIKELTPKYKDKSDLIMQDEDYFVGTSSNYEGMGMSGFQYKQFGYLWSGTFECAQYFRFNPDFKAYDSDAITFGVESFTNFLRVYLSNFIDEYNRIIEKE